MQSPPLLTTDLLDPTQPALADHPSGASRSFDFSYHGSASALFALILKHIALTIVTLGLFIPWAKTERRKYVFQNVEIDGHRLRYHGTGRELFFGYLKAVAAYLVVIALPLAVRAVFGDSAAVGVQFVMGLVLLAVIPGVIYSAGRYLLSRTSWRGIRFGRQAGAGPYASAFLKGYILTVFTLGFYAPVWMNRLYRIETTRSYLGSLSFGYDGSDKEAFSIGLKGILLSLVTCGLYLPFYQAEMLKFQLGHTTLGNVRGESLISGVDMFMLTMLQAVGLTLTLGLGFPLVMTYTLRYMLERTRFVGELDFESLSQVPSDGDAAGDGAAGVLDVGFGL